MSSKVTIIDLGVANMLSLKRAFEYCGAEVSISSNSTEILKATRLVLPGVGAFASGIRAINNLNLTEVLQSIALNREIPMLGICLGMQLLMEKSTEFGVHDGLGIIPGSVVPIKTISNTGDRLKVPNIGWRSIKTLIEHENDPLLKDVDREASLYFVHSYTAIPSDNQNRVADCIYGGHKLAAVIKKNLIYGCQFHPEKSGSSGLQIIKNYILL